MSHRPSILLVDDDPDHLLVARRAIARLGLAADVHIAHGADEALALLGLAGASGSGPSFAVVFLDIAMPGVSGWGVLERMRASERTRRVPVVMVSSSNRLEEVQRSYDLGANSYLVKRMDDGPPGDYVAEAARYWTMLNERPCGGHGGPAAALGTATGRPRKAQ
jgi:two-component system response regulator